MEHNDIIMCYLNKIQILVKVTSHVCGIYWACFIDTMAKPIPLNVCIKCIKLVDPIEMRYNYIMIFIVYTYQLIHQSNDAH